ncbi:NUDIX hydrolase [Butyricicoccus sp. Marseille-Q5471]|uniref:NUDIX hydrolase n=1 Tax=Butyricicoccus sp. Marseille-Q5471 TaxID=3039493 RepID=UPI0024BCDEFA|nr:NUDIX hydrolase [Butyricicoccus sp. Marseille-Q5471]
MELRDKNGRTEAEFLTQYRPRDYKRPSVTADIAVFRSMPEGEELLLIRRGGHPYLGKWALPGGFSEESESVEQTAMRELEEETHLTGLPIEPVGLFSTPGRDPRMWVMSEGYVARITDQQAIPVAGDDAADAAWFRVRAQQTGETLTLDFTGTAETFSAVLYRKTVLGIVGVRTEYMLQDSGGLAFDHARIIAYAMQKIGLLSSV